MENKPVLDPQLEEEKIENRKNQFFARLSGAVAGVISGVLSGYHFMQESLQNRVRRQIHMRDWSSHFKGADDASPDIVNLTLNTFPRNQRELFSNASLAPDPAVENAIEDIYTHNKTFIQTLSDKFHAKVDSLKTSQQGYLLESKNDFIQSAERIVGLLEKKQQTVELATAHNYIKEIKKIFQKIESERDIPAKNSKILLLIEKIKKQHLPAKGMSSREGNDPLRAAAIKLHDRLTKHHNNFLGEIDKAKTELIDTPIFKELLKGDNKPGHMGLGFRHADGKSKIFFKAGAIGVSVGAIAWGSARLLQLFHDRSNLQSQRSHLKTEMARREATELTAFETHARV